MQRVLSVVLLVAWALWLGGMVALLIFVVQLFKGPRAVATEAAPVLFRAFAIWQLFAGMLACAAAAVLTLRTRRNTHALLSLLLLAALAAGILVHGWTRRMEAIRLAGQSGGLEFKSLHARSSVAYLSAAGLLLVAGVGWIATFPAVQRAEGTDRA